MGTFAETANVDYRFRYKYIYIYIYIYIYTCIHVYLYLHLYILCMLPVPDRRSRVLEIVIVRRLVTWVLGIWRGEGWERVKKGEVSLQAT